MMEPDITMWNLQRNRGELEWDGCSLSGLAQQYGTPLFVVNKSRLDHSYREMLGAFRAEGLDVEIFFSFKTNPVPHVLNSLVQLGAAAEVISEFELWLATKLGLEGNRIIVNGSVKSPPLLRQAVESEVALINVEDVAELRSLQNVATELGKPVNVGLRINPTLKRRRFNLTLSTGSSSSHIGFIPGSTQWETALTILQRRSPLHLRGLHFHIGSGIRSSAPYEQALKKALEVWDDILRRGFNPEVLDIGGGFNVPTLKELNLWEAIRLFGWSRSPHPPPWKKRDNLLREIARLCSRRLRYFSRNHGTQLPKVFVEPGRALCASAQLLLLTVGAVVEREKGQTFAVCDGGAMSLSPLLLSEYHTILVANKTSNGETRKYNIVGNLPTPLDEVSLQQKLPLLASNDVLAVMDTGAYFTSLGNNFAGPRPAIVMTENGEAVLIRRRETFEDLVARDVGFPISIKER
jgi:diaminopimelate decarboxylase